MALDTVGKGFSCCLERPKYIEGGSLNSKFGRSAANAGLVNSLAGKRVHESCETAMNSVEEAVNSGVEDLLDALRGEFVDQQMSRFDDLNALPPSQ